MRILAGLTAGLSLLVTPVSVGSVPPPPPPPEEWAPQLAFFAALPHRYPAPDLAAFEALVAENVEVVRDGRVLHRTRRDWIDELQRVPAAEIQGHSVSRDQFHRAADGGISVREFSYPIAPEGKTIIYHPSAPLRYVTYYLAGGRLVRVVYGPAMDSYGGLCQAVAKARAAEGRPGPVC